jgi:RNA polymerase sigma-70 factor, ECF subfamily
MTFNEVYIKYYNELRRFGRQLNVSDELIRDFAQETFLRYFIEIKKGIQIENHRAWLYKVFLNLFKTDFSARIKISGPGIVSNGEEPAEDLQEEYLKREERRIVLEMLEKLDRKDREILLLYHDGFSYAEIAEILEMNPRSVGKTLVRAIGKLKELLKIQYHEMFE